MAGVPPTTSTVAGSRRRPRHDPKESEREIIDAGEQLLRELPFREITVERIMSLTELKRPAFYVHFRDRHDLAVRIGLRIVNEVFVMASRWLGGDHPLQDARSALEGIVALYVEHGPVLRALTEAAVTDVEVERVQRQLIQAFIDATAQHIREEQAAGRVHARIDADETARALVWLNERYLSEALGREPRANPSTVIDVLHRIWTATLYSPPNQ